VSRHLRVEVVEGAGVHSAQGHLMPRTFLNAVNVHRATTGCPALPFTHGQHVVHEWRRPLADDDDPNVALSDAWVVCSPADPGAQAWTALYAHPADASTGRLT
jgi:hypothetical protein